MASPPGSREVLKRGLKKRCILLSDNVDLAWALMWLLGAFMDRVQAEIGYLSAHENTGEGPKRRLDPRIAECSQRRQRELSVV